MYTVVLKSFLFSLFAIILSFAARTLFGTNRYLTDVGGIGVFATIFGTLYGIMTAFIVFEVWAQYNKTQALVEKEALGLERLFSLTLYFRDDKLTKKMKEAIFKYADIIIQEKFSKLASGERNREAGRVFRKISEVIKYIHFEDNRGSVIFDKIIQHYGDLSETRTERTNQSLSRLPVLLKIFLYLTSGFALLTLLIMPFAEMVYSFITVGTLAFFLAMILQIIDDLDNPFRGNWNITPEPFKRALNRIEEDYKT